MFFNRGNTMKKILLLSALLGGFALNNGYCFDEKDKIHVFLIEHCLSEFRFERFAKDLLNSTIDGKRVVDLIYYQKLNVDMLKKICDNSMDNFINVLDNVIILAAFSGAIKITVDTNKASDNALVEKLDKNNKRIWDFNFTVQPSELGQAFGDMDYDATTFETNRLQRNQLKKRIKAVKQQKQAIMQKMKPLMVE